MSRAYDLLRPNGLKLLLALTLLVPGYFVVLLVTGFPSDIVFPAVITVVVCYAAACTVDTLIQSRTLKIAIASVAAIISIILGSILVRSMTMVCDPVHDPGMVCDPVHVPATTTAEPVVIATTTPAPTTPMIFDPVHEPNSCGEACRNALDQTTGARGIVMQKLDECLQNCNR